MRTSLCPGTGPAFRARVDRAGRHDKDPIRASLRLRSDTTRTAPLGSIALFPVDQGGTFSFRIPAAGRELLASVRSDPIDLVVTLTAEPPPANAAPAAVSVDELRWLRLDS
jgi:hypothetical protein